MTNSFMVAVMVLWSTNQMDTFMTPVGDDIRRSMISVRTDIYTLPGFTPATNSVAVATNTVRLKRTWTEIPDVPDEPQLPPVPRTWPTWPTNGTVLSTNFPVMVPNHTYELAPTITTTNEFGTLTIRTFIRTGTNLLTLSTNAVDSIDTR